MVHLRHVLFGLFSCIALTACGGGSALVLEVATDLTLPAADTDLALDISQGGSPIYLQTFDLNRTSDEGGLAFPATLVLVDEGGDPPRNGNIAPGTLLVQGTGALTITLSLSKSNTVALQRSARLSMPSSAAKLLHLTLESACAGVSCAEGQTCQAAKCVGIDVDAASLPDN